MMYCQIDTVAVDDESSIGAPSMRRIMEKAWIIRMPPLGYCMDRNGSNLPILVEDPKKADLIRALFQMVGKKGLFD